MIGNTIRNLFRNGKPDQMQLNQLAAKLEQWEQWMNILSGWLIGSGNYPKFPYFEATDWNIPNIQPGVLLMRVNNQSLSAPENVDFDYVRRDTHGFADLTADPELITIPPGLEGMYLVGGTAKVNVSTGITLHLRVTESDGTTYNVDETHGGDDEAHVATMFYLDEGSTVALEVDTTNPSPTLLANSSSGAKLWATRVIPDGQGRI